MDAAADIAWISGSEQIAARVGRAIVAGDPAPGERLPREAELAIAHGVSRNTVREAMRLLMAKGLVEIVPRRGTAVRPRKFWNVLDGDLLRWCAEDLRHDAGFLRELVVARRMVEPMAARQAALSATDVQRALLVDAQRRLAAALDADLTEMLDSDLAFHIAIADASNNRFVRATGRAIGYALQLGFEALLTEPGNLPGNLANHADVIERIVARDAIGAEQAMHRLLDQSETDTGRLPSPRRN